MIPINERLILSLFDHTGNWAKPYMKAGYPVMLWDKQYEGDIQDMQELENWINGYEHFIYGILAAPPCTHFAGSGARWWKEKDKDEQLVEEAKSLVAMVDFMLMAAKVYKAPLSFWALENPVGRIETMCPWLKTYRQMIFNPCDYGDPYTKKTVLWGEFNNRLNKNPVLPLYGSEMWKLAPGPQRAAMRSRTPMGFANAFFQANK